MTRSMRMTLHCAGGICGVIAWATVGLGLAELGILEYFDPVGVMEDVPEQTLGGKIAERSLPVFVILGFLFMPSCIAWLTRSPSSPEDR
ncbi:MAG: hypothetical protein VX951_09550 [Planctomycetota bacterium]|nr:hypothetical protein [Planctomycetota bacterium]